jgi:hypothetical protein
MNWIKTGLFVNTSKSDKQIIINSNYSHDLDLRLHLNYVDLELLATHIKRYKKSDMIEQTLIIGDQQVVAGFTKQGLLIKEVRQL